RRHVPEKYEDDEHDQADRQEQRELDVGDRVANRDRSIPADIKRYGRRQLLAESREQLLDSIDDGDNVGAGLLLDRQINAAFALEPRGVLVVLDSVVDVGDLVQPDGVAVAVGNDGRSVGGRLHQLTVRLDDEVLRGAVDG